MLGGLITPECNICKQKLCAPLQLFRRYLHCVYLGMCCCEIACQILHGFIWICQSYVQQITVGLLFSIYGVLILTVQSLSVVLQSCCLSCSGEEVRLVVAKFPQIVVSDKILIKVLKEYTCSSRMIMFYILVFWRFLLSIYVLFIWIVKAFLYYWTSY